MQYSKFRLPLVLALAGLAVAISGCSGAEARHTRHMERGREYFAAENYEKARVEFGNALQIAPNDADAKFMTGRVAEKLGNIRDAAAAYQSVIEMKPEHVEARANLGRLYVFSGVPDKAMEMVEPALATQPDNAELLTVRGAARVLLKDKVGALADAEKAVKLSPTSENSVALLASLYAQSEDPSRALTLLKESTAKMPKAVDLRQVLANVYMNAGDVDGAVTTLAEVVKLKPDVPAHRFQLALLYTRLKKVDEAERVLKEGVSQLPGNRDMKLAYVDFLSAQRSMPTAEKQLKEYIAADAGDLPLQLALGALQERSRDTKTAIATYQSVIATDKDKAQGLAARNRIAAIHLREGHAPEARKLIDEVLAKNPRDNDALIMRGNLALENHDANAAIADLRAALRDQPEAVGVLRVLARAHLANNETALAEESLRRAMTLSPQDVGLRLELAQLLAQTNRIEQGTALVEESVNAAPTNLQVRETLARFYLAARQLDRARSAAEDIKTLSPESPSGFYLAGSVAAAQGRNADAVREFNRTLEIQPNAVDALAALTRMDVATGRIVEATTRVAAVVQKNPDNAPAWNLLGELQLAAKDNSAADASLARAVKLAPRWWVPYRNQGLVALARNDAPGAVVAYQRGVDATGHEPSLVTDLAMLYERMGKPDDAVHVYEGLLAVQPKLELAANNLAMLLVTHRSDAASLDRARDLTAGFSGSSNPALLDTYGWVLFKRGAFAESLGALERAVELSPKSAVLKYHLGMAQFKAGQSDKARETLKGSLQADPKFAGSDQARAALASLETRPG
jgi:tetratricopeptide (TPR) repeat protein